MNLEKQGRFLAFILRHKPESIGIELDEHGWADVKELLVGMNKQKPITMKDLEEIVATDNKQRYSFNEDKTKIRANQGHSINVDVGLKKTAPPDILFHGTGKKYVESIDKEGLKSKSRLYVHLSKDTITAKTVGSRHGSPIIYKVNAKQMAEDGYLFYLSANNVWLTDNVPAKYLEKLPEYTKRDKDICANFAMLDDNDLER